MSISRRLALAGLAVLAVAGADAAPAAASGCPAQAGSQVFLPWLDFAYYVLAPEGDVEGGGKAWNLTGGAEIVRGNETYHVGGLEDSSSMRLPPGGKAVTAPMCVGLEHPTLRLFVRGESLLSKLRVEVLFKDGSGHLRALPIGSPRGLGIWMPTMPLPLLVNHAALVRPDGTMLVSFRFTAVDGGTRIDDVYVDPYRTR